MCGNRREWAGAIVALAMAAAAPAASASDWQLVPLGTLGGSTSTAMDMSAGGIVVGCSATASGAMHAFVYSGGAMHDLGSGTDAGDGNSCAAGVNDNGLVAGWSAPSGEVVAWQDGSLVHLGIHGQVGGVNGQGTIVGSYTDTGTTRAFIYSGGRVTDPGTLGSGTGVTEANAVNEHGQVVGDSNGRAFLYDSGGMRDLGDLGGGSARANDVNDAGLVVGMASQAQGEPVAFLYDGSMHALAGPCCSAAVAINNGGEILGSAEGVYGYVVQGDSWSRLDQIPAVAAAGWHHLEPVAVNDKGWIAGSGFDANGNQQAFILVPARSSTLASAKRVDFNGDGSGDLVFRDADGSVEVRLMQGTAVVGSATFMPSAPGRILATTGDFDGDGKTDLLYQRDDGAVEMWLMQGSALVNIATLMPAGTGWRVAHVGDFDGDGKSDLLWRHTDGSVGLWLMNGASIASRSTIMGPGSQWTPALVGDFNGDGASDIAWQGADGTVSVWLMSGAAVLNRGEVATGASAIAVGDFDGDGKSDLVFQRPDGSVLVACPYTAEGATIMPANGSWTVSNAADFNGDGKSDLLWIARDGSVGIWLMNAAAQLEHRTEMPAGSGWSVSVAQDLSGDSKADLVWTHVSGSVGEWLMDGTSQTQRMPLEPAGSTKRVVPLEFGK